MELRELGKSGLKVPKLCLGGNVFGWTIDEAESFRVLDAALERGLTFIDTADIYSRWKPGNQGGESETIIGKWMKQGSRRDSVVIATKVGMEMGGNKKGLSRDYIVRAVEDSLRRLQIDVIDLYQSHRQDDETPIEETLAAYDALSKAGKVRTFGASNYDAESLEDALELSVEKNLPRYESLQPQYNLYDRADYEGSLESVVESAGIGVIPYYSLARGFLTGKYRSAQDAGKSARGESVVKNYINERGARILTALDAVAAELTSTPAAVSLAWLMARPSITAPIASATSEEQVEQLAAAVNLELSAAQIATLDEASSYSD